MTNKTLAASMQDLLNPNQQEDGIFGNVPQEVEQPQIVDAKTIRLWRKLAKRGVVEAQNNLGLAYYIGKNVKQNYEKAIYWCHKAAKQGYFKAQFNLGNAYHKGEGVEQNYKQATYWYEKAAKQGIAQAQYNLGNAYYKGEGVKSDYKQAAYWWEKAAEQGDNLAQYRLGVVYDNGEGVQQDYEKAVYWYEKAAEQGDIQAQFYLGNVYHKGEGVEQNYKQATYWYEKAAEQGHIIAQFNLTQINLTQIYDKQDDKKQEVLPLLYKVAAGLVSLDEEVDKDTVKFFISFFDEEDIDYLNKKITTGNIVAQVILAQLYKTGNGVQKDEQKAFSLFQEAVEQKDILAQYCVGLAYMKGYGIDINIEKSREQFEQIINQLKSNKDLSYAKISFEIQENTYKSPDYPRDIKQWIGLVARDKLSILDEKETTQKLAIAKQELEDIMAMIAHKFQGALASLEYNVTHQNNKQSSLDAIRTMRGLLNLFGVISTDSKILYQNLLQDMQGECSLTSVLEKSLSLAFTQLLTSSGKDKIIQHHITYAKKTGEIVNTTTRRQWRNDDNTLDLWEKLQKEWETSFMQLSEFNLINIADWVKIRMFPIKIIEFDNNSIQFQRYGITESILMIVITEIILNAIKYYHSDTNEPIKLSWKYGKDNCQFICENPTCEDEQEMGKGNYKGHKFLKTLATKLESNFSVSVNQNNYIVNFSLSNKLLMEIL
ncbi:hypothetical protein QUF74_11630 [Candidatus Halobeggiatoa sp. HSG11]|nr:hypothetical protein [Candidatus Halobeggiatoa sp. HSG11]